MGATTELVGTHLHEGVELGPPFMRKGPRGWVRKGEYAGDQGRGGWEGGQQWGVGKGQGSGMDGEKGEGMDGGSPWPRTSGRKG